MATSDYVETLPMLFLNSLDNMEFHNVTVFMEVRTCATTGILDFGRVGSEEPVVFPLIHASCLFLTIMLLACS